MNRRGFLKAFGAATAAAAAAVVADPERLLWVPGAKTFFIPEAPAAKNLIVDPGQIAIEYKAALSRAGDKGLFKAQTQGSFESWTSLGHAKFDKDWNILSLGGRAVTSAREAADLIESRYTRYGKRAPEQLVEQVAARRAAAGLIDTIEQKHVDDWKKFLG